MLRRKKLSFHIFLLKKKTQKLTIFHLKIRNCIYIEKNELKTRKNKNVVNSPVHPLPRTQ